VRSELSQKAAILGQGFDLYPSIRRKGTVSYFGVPSLQFLGDIQVGISKSTSLHLIFHPYLSEY